MKFNMANTALGDLAQKTQGTGEDLGGLVRQLRDAALPLEGKFSGAGKVAFDEFKRNSDSIANELNSSLSRILGGEQGMEEAFATGETETSDNATRAMGAANFDGARFGGRG